MQITNVMLHHSAVSLSKNKDQFKAIENYHKSLWNFKSELGFYGGYNYHISGKGKTRQTRRVGSRTASCYQKNMNDGCCIHICLDGNFDTEKPLPAQIYALRDLLLELHDKVGISKEMLVAHNEFAPKSCPGANMDLQFARNLIPGKVEKKTTKTMIYEKITELKDLIKKYG